MIDPNEIPALIYTDLKEFADYVESISFPPCKLTNGHDIKMTIKKSNDTDMEQLRTNPNTDIGSIMVAFSCKLYAKQLNNFEREVESYRNELGYFDKALSIKPPVLDTLFLYSQSFISEMVTNKLIGAKMAQA
jgi:hypothetical protein